MKKFYFFDTWIFCFLSVERRFFVLEYRITQFPGLYCFIKKLEYWPFFHQNHGFSCCKMWIFWYFNLFILKALRGVFFVLEYRKTDFLELYCLKRKGLKKSQFLTKTIGLTPWENLNFSSFWSSFFFSLERRLVLEYRKTHFPGRYWLKKDGKRDIFLTKTMG